NVLAAVRSLRRASELAADVSGGDTGLERIISVLLADALIDAGDSDSSGSPSGATGNFEMPPESWLDHYLVLLDLETRRAYLESGHPAVRSVIDKARVLAAARDLPALIQAIDACEVEYAAIAGQGESANQLSSLLALRVRMPMPSWRMRQSTVVALTLHSIAIGKPLTAVEAIESLLQD